MSGDAPQLILDGFRADRTPLVPPGTIDAHGPDMTATFAADVTLKAAQERLAELGQWLPIDGDPDAPLGRLVETNSTGPLRLGYGAWRDLLLGVQFRNGLDELITAGGRTVKNVAGYDLTKFMVGQHGIFGRIETITTRTYRMPEAAVHAAWPVHLARSDSGNPSLVSKLLPTPLKPHWTLLTPDGFFCGYLGDATAIAFFRSGLGEFNPASIDERSPAEDVAFRASHWRAAGELTFRASVPPGRLDDFLSAISTKQWAADPNFGIVLGTVDPADHGASVREAATGVGGSVQLFSGDAGKVDARNDHFMTAARRKIIEELKHAFDPDGRLTPLPWQVP